MTVALVTGAAGFIGFHTSVALRRAGFEVIGLDSFHPYYEPTLKRQNRSALEFQHGVRFIEADLRFADLREVVGGVDAIVHLAAVPGVRPSWAAFDDYVANNVLGTNCLLNAMFDAKSTARLVYASSSSVYGDALAHPTTTTAMPRPVSPYGVSKLAAENLVSAYVASRAVDAVILRYFTVYGPRQRPDMAFQALATAAAAGGSFTLYGDGSQVRDFTYVDDVASANVLACTAPVASGSIFNVASGKPASMSEVIHHVDELVGGGLKIRRSGVAVGDVVRTSADTTNTQTQLGWQPTVEWRDGISNQLKHVVETEQVVRLH